MFIGRYNLTYRIQTCGGASEMETTLKKKGVFAKKLALEEKGVSAEKVTFEEMWISAKKVGGFPCVSPKSTPRRALGFVWRIPIVMMILRHWKLSKVYQVLLRCRSQVSSKVFVGIKRLLKDTADKKEMDLETAQTTITTKLPILKQGEYDMWRLRIEQYFQVQDYALWDVIENGNSFKPTA
ncbi:hypothetical protein Tco_1280659 [Tanacetum coccineum]